MIKNFKCMWLISILTIVLMLMLTADSYAKGPKYDYSLATKMTRKLLRGVGNIAFGWVEVPKNISKEIQDLDVFTGTFTGLYKGAQRTLLRSAVGVWEVVSFPVPVPSNYSPIVEPEFVYATEVE